MQDVEKRFNTYRSIVRIVNIIVGIALEISFVGVSIVTLELMTDPFDIILSTIPGLFVFLFDLVFASLFIAFFFKEKNLGKTDESEMHLFISLITACLACICIFLSWNYALINITAFFKIIVSLTLILGGMVIMFLGNIPHFYIRKQSNKVESKEQNQ